MKLDVSKVQNALASEYGVIEGTRITAVIFPKIQADFEKMLEKAPVGAIVKEEYNFDDIKGCIKMYGSNKKITKIEINKREILF